MAGRLERAMQFDRVELQVGIDEAEAEVARLKTEISQKEALIRKARALLEGGTADLSDGASGARLTLHEAMRRVLLEEENAPMAARALADEVNRRDLYKKRDGTPVEINQIHARVNNYPQIFKKGEGGIYLAEQ
jgi:hypothetical protein